MRRAQQPAHYGKQKGFRGVVHFCTDRGMEPSVNKFQETKDKFTQRTNSDQQRVISLIAIMLESHETHKGSSDKREKRISLPS